MVRGGGRRLEVEALHRTDAAVGPVGQQHRGHRRAVAAEPLAVVFPQRLPATELAADLVHGGHQVAVLVGGRPRLVAGEVVAHPTRPEVELAGAEVEQPVEPVLGAPVAVDVDRPGRERAEREREHGDDDERREHRGAGRHRRRSVVADVVGAAELIGADVVGAAELIGDEPEDLGQGDTGEQVDRKVVEGQEADVPEPSLGQQQEDHREDPGREGQGHPEADATDAAEDRPDHRQDDEHLQRGLVDEEPLAAEVAAARPQRLHVLPFLAPPHVVEVLRVPVEGQHPERRQETGERAGDQEPGDLAPTGAQQEQRERDHQAEEGRELADLGVLQFHFSGGEPLARKDIVELVRHAREVGLYTNLITSAIGLSSAAAPDEAFSLPDVPGVAVVFHAADGDKCERCWKILPDVGSHAHHGVCGRCDVALTD